MFKTFFDFLKKFPCPMFSLENHPGTQEDDCDYFGNLEKLFFKNIFRGASGNYSMDITTTFRQLLWIIFYMMIHLRN